MQRESNIYSLQSIFHFLVIASHMEAFLLMSNWLYLENTFPFTLNSQFSKAISSIITAIFLLVTVPMNISLCLGMRSITQSSVSSIPPKKTKKNSQGAKWRRERVYVLYSIVLTISNLFKCVHQVHIPQQRFFQALRFIS